STRELFLNSMISVISSRLRFATRVSRSSSFDRERLMDLGRVMNSPGHSWLPCFGRFAISASVVSMSGATDAAFCSATRTTFVGSTIPASTRSRYRPDYLDHGDTADQLRRPLLQLVAVVLRRRILDLAAQRLDAGVDGFLLACAFD